MRTNVSVGLVIGAFVFATAYGSEETAAQSAGKLLTGRGVRPTIQLTDDIARAFHKRWDDCILRSDADGILAANTSDGRNALAEMNNRIIPWVTMAESEATNYVTPGGLVTYSVSAKWKNPTQDGTATLRIVRSTPDWPLVFSSSVKGWFRGNINVLLSRFWLKVLDPPSGRPQDTLQVVTAYDGPPNDYGTGKGVETNTYNLIIVAAPTIDRAAILNLWAYVVRQASGSRWMEETAGDMDKRIAAYDDLLRMFRTKTSHDDGKFLDGLLKHPAYEEHVLPHVKKAQSGP